MNYIEVARLFGSSDISYVVYGTIGYLKTKDNEIRQCKCLGAKWTSNDDCRSNGNPLYEWKVAGMQEHQFGSVSRLDCGIIYKTEQDAQRGGSSGPTKNGEMFPNRVVSVHEFLMRKYGLENDSFKFCGTWNDILYIETYTLMKDHTIQLCRTEFEIEVTKDGIDMTIPFLEGPVGGKAKRYATKEQAYKAQKPMKVYILDDDDDEEEEDKKPNETLVKITIEVESKNVEQIKKFATIV